MKAELKYRSFDELLDSVKIDIRTFDLEGMIDNQTLIKVKFFPQAILKKTFSFFLNVKKIVLILKKKIFVLLLLN